LEEGLSFDVTHQADALVVLLVGTAAGGLAYLGSSLVLGLEEPRMAFERFVRRT
jgi:hypothetical protein